MIKENKEKIVDEKINFEVRENKFENWKKRKIKEMKKKEVDKK